MKKCILLVLIMMAASVASASIHELDSWNIGLLGYWDFEGDGADESGYGTAADLTLGAGASLGSYNGRSCLVSGSGSDGGAHCTYNDKWDDIVGFGTTKGGLSSIERGTGITLAGWFRPNDYTAEWLPMMGMLDSGWGARVMSNRSGARGDTQTSNDGWNPVEAWNGENWNDSDWHHVVYVFDWLTDMNYMYLDGVNVWTKQRTVDSEWWAASTDTFCIGTNLDNAGYNGYIDDVCVFGGAADASDAYEIMILTPEPATMALLGLGLAMIRRRK